MDSSAGIDVLKKLELEQIDRIAAARSYINFVQIAWDEIEPARHFVNSWHVGAICEHLEAVIRGDITRLLINVPPNTSKSMTCSVMLMPWAWTQRPELKSINACYSHQIARRDSLRARNLIRSHWYQARWGKKYQIRPSTVAEDSGNKYSTDKGGFRMVTTINSTVTGEHADIQMIDDPIKPQDASGTKSITKSVLDDILTWWSDTMSTRLVDYRKSARVIMMQRLHENDLAGAMLEEGGYEHLCLPMEFEPERKCFTSIGFEDPRTDYNELLVPERFDAEAVKILKEELGPRAAQSQLQQDPVALSGNIFKRDSVKFYSSEPNHFDVMIQSWDCTFKETGGSYVVGQVWGKVGARFYLLDQVRDRWSFSQTCKQLQALSAKWPNARRKLVEAKANGIAVVDHLENTITGLELVEPKGGKEARANAIEPYWTAGNIFLPHPKIAPWIVGYIDEHVKFPAGKNDDQVDATTQAVSHLGQSHITKLRAALGAL